MCGRAGQHFEGLAAAARWLVRRGCKGKTLKKLAQLDVVAVWMRRATALKSDELAARVGLMLGLGGFASAACSLGRPQVWNLLQGAVCFDIRCTFPSSS